ncbi:hypothetical protein ACJJTC_016606 [Scirpophaga incertulas]
MCVLTSTIRAVRPLAAISIAPVESEAEVMIEQDATTVRSDVQLNLALHYTNIVSNNVSSSPFLFYTLTGNDFQLSKFQGVANRWCRFVRRLGKEGTCGRADLFPKLSRGRGDARNILGVILQKTDDELYQPGTKQGVVKTLYSRHQFTVCHQELLKIEDVPNLKTTLRTVATLHSTGTGQGFVK